jgi:cell division transport system permease protein
MSTPKPGKGANSQLARRHFTPRIWMLRHLQAALSSLGRLSRTPISTVMTVAVIGIAMALPTGLHVLLDNVQQLAGRWDSAATISLFLQQGVAEDKGEALAKRLRKEPGIEEVQLIGRQEALNEFRRFSGFAGALDALEENPLPVVLMVTPAAAQSSPREAEALVKKLQQIDEVEFAQLDLQWVRRFQAITEIATRGVYVLASLLALAVLLIVGNTIRLDIQNRHAEIEITKLVGGTDAFIRRPFLYYGLWYGLLGGWLAWLLISLSLSLLSGPVEHLALLYHSDFDLSSVNISTILTLMAGGGLLGLGGSWVAVGRHLSAIEPT